MELPPTKAAAKKAGSKYYFTGKTCKYGHTSKRSTSTGKCLECDREQYHANSDSINKTRREDRKRHPYKYKKQSSKSYQKNKESILSRNREWRKNNKGRVSEYNKWYRSENPGKNAAYIKAYKLDRIKRTVNFKDPFLKELNEICCSEIYQQSQDLSAAFEEDYHVDHIVPLRGDYVSGFHVWYNLQILTASENMSKNNLFDSEMENYYVD